MAITSITVETLSAVIYIDKPSLIPEVLLLRQFWSLSFERLYTALGHTDGLGTSLLAEDCV